VYDNGNTYKSFPHGSVGLTSIYISVQMVQMN